ncbi:hypothetical protein BH11ARM2_BH11ARM2_00110 [soil metagenome]
MTFDRVSEIAAELPGVTEEISYGAPSFKIGKSMLARLREDGVFVLKCAPDDRDALIAAQPETFSVTPHYEKHPYVLVDLETISEAQLESLLGVAWRMVAPEKLQDMA